MSASKAVWRRDDGYSGCKTARFGYMAVVVCPPDFSGCGWGFQAFYEDECDGEVIADGYGFKSEESVIEYVEGCMNQ